MLIKAVRHCLRLLPRFSAHGAAEGNRIDQLSAVRTSERKNSEPDGTAAANPVTDNEKQDDNSMVVGARLADAHLNWRSDRYNL